MSTIEGKKIINNPNSSDVNIDGLNNIPVVTTVGESFLVEVQAGSDRMALAAKVGMDEIYRTFL